MHRPLSLALCPLAIVVLLAGCSGAETPSSPPTTGKAATVEAARRLERDTAEPAPPPSAPPAPLAVASPMPASQPPAITELKARPAAEAKMDFSNLPQRNAQPSEGGLDQLRAASEPTDREQYAHQEENPVKRAAEQPVSTFSIDVDTGSYANVRRFLNQGRLPPHDAVRVEELINYFTYDYPSPDSRQPPFRVSTELAPTPWNPKTLLLAVGIKGYELPKTQLPPANLVFLIDVSGSMDSPDKIGLLKPALKLLTRQLRPEDKLAIAVYAGAAGVVLEPTPGSQKAKIEAALDRLSAGGSTNGGAGIQLAYNLARDGWVEGGVNRVILATDGDFNVGTVNFEALKNLVETQRKSGVALTTLGFGAGNYNDPIVFGTLIG